ncbi:MAG: tRNA (N(6)-L-threonylcarbamoyladenosine(37)-C(2))-methylthiotransferase MtaB [Nitrospirae bacterium]|nr:tRNA (N(6)-L-threonylcarbamoyladenosine(37)-C(2))-methylthiotransferase MtaB [Nitrospirota bacterium]
MRIAIATLGCKVNQSESASIEGALRTNGYQFVDINDSPDICIVNTCTVTSKSDYQSRQIIRRAVKSGARVVATGCYAELKAKDISNIEGVSLVVGNQQKEKLPEYINRLFGDNNDSVTDEPASQIISDSYYSSRARAFLKIQDGCNLSCSYCAIPKARGRSRSITTEKVLSAADRIVNEGYKEIVLTGIHIGSYGIDLTPKSSLVDIVDKLVNKYDTVRFRLSSLEPQEVNAEFISLIKEKKLCPHMHIPLQSGSDTILKSMNRGYSVSMFKNIVNKMAEDCPDISIGTDVIVGFPGEREEDFKDTFNLLEELPISYFHVFPYSRRENTAAEKMPDHISASLKKQRVKLLLDLSNEKKNLYIAGQLGKILDVVIENKAATPNLYKGISDNYIRLSISSNCLSPGQRLRVRAISLTPEGLIVTPL